MKFLFFCNKRLIFFKQTSVLFIKSKSWTRSIAHSEHRFPAPSSKLGQIELHHWRGTLYLHAAVQRHGQCPPKGSGTNMTVEAT